MKRNEFDITLKLKVEADNLTQARSIANAIVNDLEKVGEEYVDRPINHVRWNRITPVISPEQESVNAMHRDMLAHTADYDFEGDAS